MYNILACPWTPLEGPWSTHHSLKTSCGKHWTLHSVLHIVSHFPVSHAVHSYADNSGRVRFNGPNIWNSTKFCSVNFPDYVQEHWQDDDFFAYQYLNAINPTMIQRCSTLPKNFPVKEDILSGQLKLEDEMKVTVSTLIDCHVLPHATLNFDLHVAFTSSIRKYNINNVCKWVKWFLMFAKISNRKETYSCVTTSVFMEWNRTSPMRLSSSWWLLSSCSTKHLMIGWCQLPFRWE